MIKIKTAILSLIFVVGLITTLIFVYCGTQVTLPVSLVCLMGMTFLMEIIDSFMKE